MQGIKKKIIRIWNYFIKVISPSYIFRKAEIHIKKGNKKRALNILYDGLRFHPKNKAINGLLLELLREGKNWGKLITRLEVLSSNKRYEDNFELYIELSMVYQITGNHAKADAAFEYALEKHSEKVTNDELGYRKLTIFDNGESRIEFYKKLVKTKRVIITFDSINMVWENPSFAFKLLIKKDLDIIAIRKRESRTYQQDLHQEDFLETIKPLMNKYTDKMAYGFSLGAYHTLYFASLLNCRILAFSPRLSIHPEFGRTRIIPKHKMKHNLIMAVNSKITPIIVFDPKNDLDTRYINEGILPKFPNSILVKIPYGGHGIAPHLLKTGLLKQFVQTFLNNSIPIYDRTLKSKSHIYFRNLGAECLRHNKYKWALDLANKSLEMAPTDLNSIKLKLKTLKKLKCFEAARDFATDSVKLIPNNLDLRLYLTDIYLELENFKQAEIEIDHNLAMFGNRKSIKKRIETLHRLKQEIVL